MPHSCISAWLAVLVLGLGTGAGCSPDTEVHQDGGSVDAGGGGARGSGGRQGSGGKTGSGGSIVGSGGKMGSGGSIVGSGGKTGSGGSIVGSGGKMGSGGSIVGSGGKTGSGGSIVGSGGSIVGSGGSIVGSGGSIVGSGGGPGSGGAAGTTFAEQEDISDCVIPSLPAAGSLPSIAKLPDTFKKIDGTRMAAKSEWRCRRAEIRAQAEKYIYGTKPPKPASVTGTVSNNSITVKVTENGKTASFSVSVELPTTGTAPYPAVIGLGGGMMGFPLPAATVKAEGVAIINYDPYAVGSESGTRANKSGAFYTIYGSNSQAGLLVAWSWGVSRIIDVLAQSDGKILKADAIGVSGCSRFGKGAFTIGAFDQRIALTMPIESGTGGVPIWRGLAGENAQSPSSAYGETYWLGDAFSAFTSKVAALPIDTHEMVSMVAPRGLFIMDNPHIANLGPKSAHVAALGGAELYKALGAGTNISYVSNVADGNHCAQRPEWTTPLQQNIRKFLTKKSNDPGVINAHSKATGSLATWRDWTTPTLQ